MDDDQSDLPARKTRRASPRPMEFVLPADMDATLVRYADSLYSRKPILWSVVEAAIWITTRQHDLVDMVQAHKLIRSGSIGQADLDLKKVLRDQPHLWPNQEPPLLWPAINALTLACARGDIVMSGLQANIGTSEEVPVSAWVGMEIREGGDAGIVAAPPGDWHRPGVAWWGGLAVRRDDVLELWHSDKNEQPAAREVTGKDETQAKLNQASDYPSKVPGADLSASIANVPLLKVNRKVTLVVEAKAALLRMFPDGRVLGSYAELVNRIETKEGKRFAPDVIRRALGKKKP